MPRRPQYARQSRDQRRAFRYARLDGVVLVGRNRDGRQNADDRYHDHQFDQCKTTLQRLHFKNLQSCFVATRASRKKPAQFQSGTVFAFAPTSLPGRCFPGLPLSVNELAELWDPSNHAMRPSSPAFYHKHPYMYALPVPSVGCVCRTRKSHLDPAA